jgi:hypothetical protein
MMSDFDKISNEIKQSNDNTIHIARQLFGLIKNEIDLQKDDFLSDVGDVKALMVRMLGLDQRRYSLKTEKPIAYESNDHTHPHGTQNDNSRRWHFVKTCEKLVSKAKLAFLDLGCSGGGWFLTSCLMGTMLPAWREVTILSFGGVLSGKQYQTVYLRRI